MIVDHKMQEYERMYVHIIFTIFSIYYRVQIELKSLTKVQHGLKKMCQV